LTPFQRENVISQTFDSCTINEWIESHLNERSRLSWRSFFNNFEVVEDDIILLKELVFRTRESIVVSIKILPGQDLRTLFILSLLKSRIDTLGYHPGQIPKELLVEGISRHISLHKISCTLGSFQVSSRR